MPLSKPENPDKIIPIQFVPSGRVYSVEDNPYENIYLDITMRCNMACNYCYSPHRMNQDMDIAYFREVCQRLPNPVFFRFLGGEPTLHPQLFDFITTAKEHGHQVFFASNGLRYNDPEFMEGLKALGGGFCPGLSIDGGSTNDDLHELLNGRKCLSQKLSALENLHKYGIGRVTLSAIIVRGLNEHVIGELLELAEHYSDVVRFIHFRNAGKTGRWIDTEPYDLAGLKEVCRPYFTDKQFRPRCAGEIFCTPDEGGDCCYRFRPTPRLQVSLVEFATPKSARCPKRGKLLSEGFKIEPFFENLILTGETLAETYGEVALPL